jgi:hypothetical protein
MRKHNCFRPLSRVLIIKIDAVDSDHRHGIFTLS